MQSQFTDQFNDREFMTRIAAHDQQAFHALYQQYGKAIYSLAYHILQNATLAEEVTQDTFLKVWRQKTQWNPDKGTLKNWLLAITHFTAIDRLRQERRQPNLHPNPIEDIETELPHSDSQSGWQDDLALRMLL